MIELVNKIIYLQAIDVQRLGHYWYDLFFYLSFYFFSATVNRIS